MKQIMLNIYSGFGVIAQISDWNKILTLVLIITAILLNIKNLMKK